VSETAFDVAILGAGVSGLCLARALAEGPLRGLTVALVDGARDDAALRTLSFWASAPTAVDDLVSHAWSALRIHHGSRVTEVPLRTYRYQTLFLADLRRAVCARYASSPGLRVVEGRAGALEAREGGVGFAVEGERFFAKWVFDSRFAREALVVEEPRWHLRWQHIQGWIVRTERDVFDTRAAAFFDFRTGLSVGDTFFYVLPFSPREALLELVSFEPVDAENAARHWLTEHAGLRADEFHFERREGGLSPMTEQPFERVAGARVRRIGIPAGRLKASTGYALTRILADCDAIVRSLVRHGHPFEAPSEPRLYRLLDGVLLELWAARPAAMPAIFEAMFERGRGDRALRFLDERATWWDLVCIVSTLPMGPFIGAAARWLWRRLRASVSASRER
jgi:lycopene beta-cyclase